MEPATPAGFPAGGGCGTDHVGIATWHRTMAAARHIKERIIMFSQSTDKQRGVPVLGIGHNQANLDLRQGDRFLVRLFEDPDIGRDWRANMTPGLQVLDNWFTPSGLSRPLAGGFHYWSISAKSAGRHIFRAVYRGWNNESALPPMVFQVQVNVVPGRKCPPAP
jgi:predicted secreted protein